MNSESLKILLSGVRTEDAPAGEPERQYYFIERLREYFEAEDALREGGAREQSGPSVRPRTAAVVTFGCQMNARDSEKLSGILAGLGYGMTADEPGADLVIFNTCTVRENANEHLYGRLGRLKASKKQNPDKIIAVCGCMMQEKDEAEGLRTRYPYVDLIFGTHNLYTFPELLYKLIRKRCGIMDKVAVPGPADCNGNGPVSLSDSDEDLIRAEKLLRYKGKSKSTSDRELLRLYRKPVVSVWKDSSDIVENIPSKRKYSFKQGINIMFGCNNFCSYCIVPYVRGREKSRRPEEIYAEIRRSAAEGVKEIMLLGQNVNSYDGGIRFPELLREVDRLAVSAGIERVRFMTSHPKDLSRELVEVMAEGSRICHQFHLPLQSGSDSVLKRMNRRYTRAAFIERAEWLKEAMPDISMSTDIIVGFPGETEEDFEDTLEVLSRVRFDQAYTFIYSRREGTPAASYKDQVDEDTVKDRFSRLLSLQNAVTRENLEKLTGGTYPVLFENISEFDPALVTGKLESGLTVHMPGDAGLIGEIRRAVLKECRGFYYIGELV